MRVTTSLCITAAAIGCSLVVLPAPHAQAQPACAHRSASHAAQAHTTREGDSRWHVAHGGLPTCNLDQKDDSDDSSKDSTSNKTPFYRDHQGFHCYHFHCG